MSSEAAAATETDNFAAAFEKLAEQIGRAHV